MKPAFGILRRVERRQSNATITEQTSNTFTKTRSEYQIMVTQIVVLWLTVWTTETDWT